MSNLDLHYMSVGRFLLHLKFNSKFYNSFEFLKLKELNVFFFLKSIEDMDHLCVSNYFYFFKFFFGRIGFFSNYSYIFSLNIEYHSFIVQLNCYKKYIYHPLLFLMNDINSKLKASTYTKTVLNNKLTYTVNDMNFFTDKKTTIGFFNLIHNVNFNVVCEGGV